MNITPMSGFASSREGAESNRRQSSDKIDDVEM